VGSWLRKNQNWLSFVVVSGAVLGVWELLTRLLRVPPYILPPPSEVVRVLGGTWGPIVKHLRVTISEILAGYALTVLISIPCATLISYSRVFERTIYPFMVLLQLIPKVAIAPLFILWFGFGFLPKVLMVFLLSFFPLVIDSTVGFKSLSPRLILLGRSMTDSEWDFFWKVRLPNALPNIFAGLKVSIAFATVGAIVGEFVGSDKGLGYLLLRANGDLNTGLLFAVLVVLSLVGVILFELIEVAERLAIPWHASKRRELMGGEATL
jgi:NitT/TauT family transport system permease protein